MASKAFTNSREPFAWQALEERVREYLRDEGLASAEAGRLSHAVIRMCADAADSIDRDSLPEQAMDEARTLLATWQATRREQVFAGV